MTDEYTVLPSANSVLGVFVNGGQINTFYNGTNTKAEVVGAFANKNELLLLIKFRAEGFFSFYGFNQDELYWNSETLTSSVADSPLKHWSNQLVVGKCFRCLV